MPKDEQKPYCSGQHEQPEQAPQETQEMMDGFCRALVKAVREEAARRQEPGAEEDNGEKQIDLVAFFYRLLAGLKYVIIAAVLGAVLGGVYAYQNIVPLYSATAKLYVISSGNSVVNLSDLQIGSFLKLDYQEVFRTWEVHEMVRDALNLPYSYSKLQSMLTISNPENTRVLYITVTDTSAQEAADIANAYATAAKRFIVETMATEEPNSFSIALVPSYSISAGKTRYVLIGFLLGTLLGVGVIFLSFILDDRPRTPDDIERYAGLPTLAIIPATGRKNNTLRLAKQMKKRQKES